MPITNSNSNLGAVSRISWIQLNEAFDRDDVGYITHIILPHKRTRASRIANITWLSLDAQKIVSTGATKNRKTMCKIGYNSEDVPPPSQIDSYRLGAKRTGDQPVHELWH